MIYLIALYCMAPEPPNPWLRERPKVEAPACFEYREEYRDTFAECNTRGVVTQSQRLAKLHGKPFVFAGAYCKREPQ